VSIGKQLQTIGRTMLCLHFQGQAVQEGFLLLMVIIRNAVKQ
jgi:hypothetical protein